MVQIAAMGASLLMISQPALVQKQPQNGQVVKPVLVINL